MSSWEDYYDHGMDQFLEQNDPDDWEGLEYEYCTAQVEFACNYADTACENDDDDGYDDDDRPGPGGQGLDSQSNEEWFATLGEFNS